MSLATSMLELMTRLEALRLRTNMNWGGRQACVGVDVRGQPVIEPVRANPRGQYDYGIHMVKNIYFG